MSGAATAGLEMYNLNPSFVYSFGTSLYIDRFCYGCQNHSVNWFISFLFYFIFLFFYFYSVLYVTEGRIKCGDAGRRRSHVTRCQEMRWRSSWNWCHRQPSSTINHETTLYLSPYASTSSRPLYSIFISPPNCLYIPSSSQPNPDPLWQTAPTSGLSSQSFTTLSTGNSLMLPTTSLAAQSAPSCCRMPSSQHLQHHLS